jgi:hypothetical protein
MGIPKLENFITNTKKKPNYCKIKTNEKTGGVA